MQHLLSKKEKGRLKKLHSKSSLPSPLTMNNDNNGKNHKRSTRSFTGIICNQEAEEYQLLVSKKNQSIDHEKHHHHYDDNDNDDDNGTKTLSSSAAVAERTKIMSKNETENNYIENKTVNNKQRQQPQKKIIPNGPFIQLKESSSSTRATTTESCSGNDNHENINKPRITEGDDHRNLLHALLFLSSQQHNNNYNTNSNDKKMNNNKRKHTDDTSNDHHHHHDKKNEHSSFTMPSWVNVHNPALIQNIVVLEFSITKHNNKNNMNKITNNTSKNLDGDDNENEQDIFLTQQPILSSKILTTSRYYNTSSGTTNNNNNNNLHCQYHVLYTKMKLFQDNNTRPKHITDVIMYSDRKEFNRHDDEKGDDNNYEDVEKEVVVNKKQRNEVNNIDTSNNSKNHDKCNESTSNICNEIYAQLEQMILTHKQLRQEGYPISFNKHTEEGDYDDNNDNNIQSIYSQLLDYGNKIYKFQQDGNMINKNTSYCKDDIYDFLSSSSFKLQAGNIVEKVHQHQKLQNMNNCDEENPRLFVTSFLERKDLSTLSSSVVNLDSNNHNDKKKFNVYALDCEMVRTEIGLELARISLILFNPTHDDTERYKVVLDSYVKPKHNVLDYITQYSGITPSILRNVTTSLEEIQTILLSTICKDDILIGHSLENDLNATRFIHYRIIDTALLFRSVTNGRKHSLKHLSLCLLKQRIQQGPQLKQNNGNKVIGHDSIEDASTTLVLALRRAKNGPTFKLYDKNESKINLLERLSMIRMKNKENQSSYFQRKLRIHNGPLVCLGPMDWIKDHVTGRSNNSGGNAAHVLQCDDIHSSSTKAIASYLKPGSTRNASFLWAKICVDASLHLDYETRIDELLSQILQTSPPNSVFNIMIQNGYNEAKKMYKQRSVTMKDPRSTFGWNDYQEKVYKDLLRKSCFCDSFWVTTGVGGDGTKS